MGKFIQYNGASLRCTTRTTKTGVRMIKRRTKILIIGFAILVGLLTIGYVSSLRPDIPMSVLEHKYGTPDSKFLSLGTARVHYRDRGDPARPTLLLIHGFGVSLETWEPWVRRLQSRYRIVSIDLPGHGLTQVQESDVTMHSNVEFVATFMRAMNLSSAVIAGNSFGGAVAWNLALTHPEQIAGLVLVDASGWEWMAQQNRGGVVLKLMDSPLLRNVDKTFLFRQILTLAYADKALATDALVERYVELSRAPGHREILDRTFVRTASGADSNLQATPEKLAGIKTPTLILWGERDELIPVSDAEKFRDSIENSKVIVYANTGHVLMEEAAERSASDLDAWIAGIVK
jgi:pimeloyl-ACP methyl ester carboxylesterase